MADDLPISVSALASELPQSAVFSVHVVDLDQGSLLASAGAELILSSASTGKVLALIDLAERSAAGEISLSSVVSRSITAPVGDSGIWQRLLVDELALADIAALIGATSDNLGANVLIEHLGLDRIQECGRRYGLEAFQLHDLVRDARGPQHPSMLSSASSEELVGLIARLHRERESVGGHSPGAQVLDWLSLNTDLSMVSSAFGLDPLAHEGDTRGISLASKTGTDVGVRADMGLVERERTMAYSVIVNWDEPQEPLDRSRDAVLRFMRRIGTEIRQQLKPS